MTKKTKKIIFAILLIFIFGIFFGAKIAKAQVYLWISEASKSVFVDEDVFGQVKIESKGEMYLSGCRIEFGDGTQEADICKGLKLGESCQRNFWHPYNSPGEKTISAQCYWVLAGPGGIGDEGTFTSQETINVIEAPVPAEPIETVNPLEATTLAEIINSVANTVFYIITSLAVLFIMIGGFFILSAGGNPAQIIKGKKIILYTVIGFAIMVLSKGIIDLVYNILGVEIPTAP
jgi:hypothetical protein